MKFAFFTFSGYSLPIAKRLVDEGNEVIVGMVSSSAKLNVEGWQGEPEGKEDKKRRLSLYDGMLDKIDADELVKRLRFEKDKNEEETFVVVDHNNLCDYGEKLLAFGMKGIIPVRYDYEIEKDREKAKKFVEKNFDSLLIPEGFSFKKIQDGIDLVDASDDLWVLKSNGNLGSTIVPKTKDIRLNHMQITGALKVGASDYEKGGYLLEKKIVNPIEFTPQIAFWDGEPIFTQVEMECKPIGAGDTGQDGGGSISLLIRTDLDDPINTLFFPPVVHKLAKSRSGLFLFDIGILYDSDNEEFYFTEFCGNRWGWGTIFAELAMSTNKNRNATEYFERISQGKSPLRYKYGAYVAFYNLLPDKKVALLEVEELPIYFKRAAEEYLWLYQARKDDTGTIVNVGCGNILLGYASGCGNSLSATISSVYKIIDNLSFKELLYRPKFDFLSREYTNSILNRYDFLNHSYINVSEEETV